MKNASPYRWPAEWETQSATWIAWPHNAETWPDRFDPIPTRFKQFIATLCSIQPVHVLAGPESASPKALDMLCGLSNVTIHDVPTNDCWIRDYGPTFVRRVDDGSLVGIDWKYNAWGGKYPPYDRDAAAAEAICRLLACPRSQSSLYCEGGSLDTDGLGTLLTTSSCLMSVTRNPGWTRTMIEDELGRQLGIRKTIWVDGGGLLGDDTDGHIDQLARFVRAGVVVAACSSGAGDPNHNGLQENLRILRQASDVEGQPLEVHELPTPPPRFVGTARVPESYCNFLIVNGAVLVPSFRHDATDQFAVELLGRLFPTRSIISQDAHDLAWGLGAFHCASQQQPAT